jgi:hypothetical protein
MIGFFRNHIQGFSKVAQPITDLLQKNRPFKWDTAQENAFRKLKELITTAPILAHPDFDKPFILYTDASKEGVGAILAQEQDDGRIHPIQFVSHRNNKAERNYPITDLEGLAVIWAVKKLKRYLRYSPFKIVTDHSALKYLFSKDEIPEGRRGRWMIYLQQFNYSIEHRAGKKMPHVDYLSRNPLYEPEDPEEETFIGNVGCYKPKFGMTFIYNYYGPFMSVRTVPHLYGLHQSPCGKAELQDKNGLDICKRELKEETGLDLPSHRFVFVGRDHKTDCDIYAVRLTLDEMPEWREQNKMGPWGLIPWDMYIRMVRLRQVTSSHISFMNLLLKVAGILTSEPTVRFEGWDYYAYYDPEDSILSMHEKHEWIEKPKQTIDKEKRQQEQKLKLKGKQADDREYDYETDIRNNQIGNRIADEEDPQLGSSEGYQAYWNMNKERLQSEEPVYLVNEVWWDC